MTKKKRIIPPKKYKLIPAIENWYRKIVDTKTAHGFYGCAVFVCWSFLEYWSAVSMLDRRQIAQVIVLIAVGQRF